MRKLAQLLVNARFTVVGGLPRGAGASARSGSSAFEWPKSVYTAEKLRTLALIKGVMEPEDFAINPDAWPAYIALVDAREGIPVPNDPKVRLYLAGLINEKGIVFPDVPYLVEEYKIAEAERAANTTRLMVYARY